LSIGYANICSSVQDHRQKKIVYLKIRYWKNKREQWNQQVNEALHIWIKVLLKLKCSWSDDVSSEASSSESPHQNQDH